MNRYESLSSRDRALVLIGIVLGGFICIALLAEVGIRFRQWIKHGAGFPGIEKLYQVDPGSGLRIPVPGLKTARIAINSLGFRGPEITVPKPKNTIRIAFLGASTTFSAEVSGNEVTWPHLVVEAFKRKRPERHFDYVNAGVPGYVVRSSLKNLEARVKPLDPDVIIIYHATNDLSGISYEAALRQGVAQPRGDQSLSWPAEISLLWYLIEKNLLILQRQRESVKKAGKLKADARALAEPFKRDLMALAKASREIAEVVVLVTYSTRIRSEQSPEERREAAVTSLYYMPYMTPESLLEAFAAYNQVITEVARELDLALVEGESIIPGDDIHFVDSAHFTDAGSRAMAGRVVSGLLDSGAMVGAVGTTARIADPDARSAARPSAHARQ